MRLQILFYVKIQNYYYSIRINVYLFEIDNESQTSRTSDTISSFSQLKFTSKDLEPEYNSLSKQFHIIRPDPNKICPCTLCPDATFKDRDEQLKHYHTENHLQRLKDYCASKVHEPLTIQSIYKNKTDQDDNISIFTNNTVEDINNNISYYCQCCNQYFKTESALDHHNTTNKHKMNQQTFDQQNKQNQVE